MTARSVTYLDTMRLSLRRRAKSSIEVNTTKTNEKIPEVPVAIPKESEESKPKDSLSRIPELTEKEAEPPPQRRLDNSRNQENFRRMRPTSWSPPPGKPKHLSRVRTSDPGPFDMKNRNQTQARTLEVSGSSNSWNPRSFSVGSSSRIEIVAPRPETNVCKITVSPRASPLVHRLQIGGNDSPRGARRTSILINGDQPPGADTTSNDNKVTISVGGEDSVCNPTVISVNSASPPKIQSTSENRTLVILENFKSNIVVESEKPKEETRNMIATLDDKSVPELPERTERNYRDKRHSKISGVGKDEDCSGFKKSEQNSRFLEESSRSSTLSKEALISKLLEDWLRKARENGEILDQSSGDAILRFIKKSLLKGKEYESSESTIEPEATYSTSPSLNSDTDFVSTNLFVVENPYEVVDEPIYEEIPDEPPPLPLSPPPTEDCINDRLFFVDKYKEDYYTKVNAGKYLGSYTSEDMFKNKNGVFKSEERTQDFFTKVPPTTDESLPSNLLNFFRDSKDRVTLDEEDEDEEDEEDDEEDEDTEGDLDALYVQKETSMGDLSSKSSQISNVSDSSEECNIILTSSPETLKVI